MTMCSVITTQTQSMSLGCYTWWQVLITVKLILLSQIILIQMRATQHCQSVYGVIAGQVITHTLQDQIKYTRAMYRLAYTNNQEFNNAGACGKRTVEADRVITELSCT